MRTGNQLKLLIRRAKSGLITQSRSIVKSILVSMPKFFSTARSNRQSRAPIGALSASVATSPSIRRNIFAAVIGIIILSLVGSVLSLYRITRVNQTLDTINRQSIPLGSSFAKLRADAEIFRREMDRRLGYANWKKEHWNPQPTPQWILDLLRSEMQRADAMVSDQPQWRNRIAEIRSGLEQLHQTSDRLYELLAVSDFNQALQVYPDWIAQNDEWMRQLRWAAKESERFVRASINQSEKSVASLKYSLQLILAVVILFSLMLLWFGERALRPLWALTQLARQITARGLRSEDKELLPQLALTRKDEISHLAREFHRMATTVLERERELSRQQKKLEDQNQLLTEMGSLNKNIINSIDDVLVVIDTRGRLTQWNWSASQWLSIDPSQSAGQKIAQFSQLEVFARLFTRDQPWSSRVQDLADTVTLPSQKLDEKIYSAKIIPLKDQGGSRDFPGRDEASVDGVILLIADITEKIELQNKVRQSENLAAIGRMTAQVAHDVRNPLHSIGLEAELANDLAREFKSPPLKQATQSILESVDRLEQITENYLKLSRASTLHKKIVDLDQILERVLATYGSECQSLGIRVDWRRETRSRLQVRVDSSLIEQALGNLFKNSIQALSGVGDPWIEWSMGHFESGKVWVKIQDNGPGITQSLQEKIFSPFTTTKAQGTGLGLSFIKKIIEEHGGDVEYCSNATPPSWPPGSALEPPKKPDKKSEKKPGKSKKSRAGRVGATFLITLPAPTLELEIDDGFESHLISR